MGDYETVPSLEPIELKEQSPAQLVIYISEAEKSQQKLICNSQWTIRDVRMATYPQVESGYSVRFFYMGRIIQDTETLEGLEIHDECVIQAQVAENKPPETEANRLPTVNVLDNGYNGYELTAEDYLQETAEGDWNSRVSQMNNQGTMTQFFLGLFLGLAFGQLILFYFCLANLPRRQRAGLVVGVLISLLYDYIWGRPRFNLTKSSFPDSPGDGNATGIIYE